MKAVVHIGRNSKEPINLLRHIFRPHARGGDEVKVTDRVAGIINGIELGVITRDPKTDLDTLLANHHGRGRKVRHVVLSMEDTYGAVERAKVFLALSKMARAFAYEFAPGCDFFGVLHQDRRHPHVHLVICNSDGLKCLDWRRATLAAMQAIETYAPGLGIQSGRGKGILRSAPGRSPYTLPKKSRSKELAELLFSNPGGLDDALQSGTVTVGRRTKAGKISSLEWEGHRYRVATLLRVAMGMGLDPFWLPAPTAPEGPSI